MLTKIRSLLILMLFLGVLVEGHAIADVDIENKLAFLKNGEIWLADLKSSKTIQLTTTREGVNDFIFSPSLRYLAYANIIKYDNEPGLWEDEKDIPKRAVCSIVIVDITARKIIQEISPDNGSWIYISRWLNNEKLLYYASSGFDVSDFFEYYTLMRQTRKLDYSVGSQLLGSTFSVDGSLKTFISNRGTGKDYRENLHLIDLNTNTDKVLISKKNITMQNLSDNRQRIAFVEVENINNKYFDNLYQLNLKTNSLKKLYRGPSRPKSGGSSKLSWSNNGQYLAMFLSGVALIVDINNQDNLFEIRGANFNWLNNKQIVFAQGNNIFFYNLTDMTKAFFIKDATKPLFLSAPSSN